MATGAVAALALLLLGSFGLALGEFLITVLGGAGSAAATDGPAVLWAAVGGLVAVLVPGAWLLTRHVAPRIAGTQPPTPKPVTAAAVLVYLVSAGGGLIQGESTGLLVALVPLLLSLAGVWWAARTVWGA